ncbi:GNAT family N-acetyltransferase [Candidatus Dojkabacteria bacterium]|nr:GNAT family N-acetyltransferase [Candidatus Dojkabacteria bacterium]
MKEQNKILKFKQLDKENLVEASELLETAITDIFTREGLTEDRYKKILADEIELQKNRLMESVDNTCNYYAYAALKGDAVVGIICHGRLTDPITKAIEGNRITQPDTALLTAYVHPDYQRQGIGGFLFENITKTLQEKGISSYALDSAYQSGIAFWTKMLGKQSAILRQYYENKYDCYIWYREIGK